MKLIEVLQAAYELFKKGSNDDALILLDRAISQWPRQAKLWQLKSMVLKAKNQFQSSLSCLKQALEFDKNDPEIHNNIANLYQTNGQPSLALDHYKKAISLRPDYVEAIRNLALCYSGQGNSTEALALLNEVEQKTSLDFSARLKLANLQRELGQFEKAETNYQVLLGEHSQNSDVWYHKGMSDQLQGDFEAAEKSFARACKLNPSHMASSIKLAMTEAHAGKMSAAIERLESCVKANPLDITAHNALNSLLWESGQQHLVGRAFESALRTNPDDYQLNQAFIKHLIKTDESDRAAAQISKAIDMFSESSELLWLRAKLFAHRSENKLAIRDFEASLLASYQPDKATDLIQIMLIEQQFNEAQKIIDQSFKYGEKSQLLWALQSVLWRQQADDRYEWLCQYNALVQDFILSTPDGFDSLDEFLSALEVELLSLHHSVNSPLEQTLRNGSQTAPKVFENQIREIVLLKEECAEIVREYLSSLKHDANHPFLSRIRASFRFSGSWSVRLFNDGYHVNHVHPQGWISSSSYIALPKFDTTTNEGCIQFGQSSLLLENESIEKLIRPQEGMVVLFPSYIWHGTVPFSATSEKYRLTAPFDVVPSL